LTELVAALESALGKKATIQRLPPQPGDVDRTFADITRAQAELGYSPSTDFKTGLAHFVDWLRAQDSG